MLREERSRGAKRARLDTGSDEDDDGSGWKKKECGAGGLDWKKKDDDAGSSGWTKDVGDGIGVGWGATLWKKKDYRVGGGWGASSWKKEDDAAGGAGWTKEPTTAPVVSRGLLAGGGSRPAVLL